MGARRRGYVDDIRPAFFEHPGEAAVVAWDRVANRKLLCHQGFEVANGLDPDVGQFTGLKDVSFGYLSTADECNSKHSRPTEF